MKFIRSELQFLFLVLFLVVSCDSKRIDPEPNKAFGKINFGITNKEYNEMIAEALNDLSKEGSYYSIGEFKFDNIAPEFYNNKFYKITFSGYRYRTLNEIRKAVQLISAEFDEKYGKHEFKFDFLTEQYTAISNQLSGPSWNGTDKSISLNYLVSDTGYEIFLTIEKVSISIEIMSDEYKREKMENKKLKEIF